MLLRYFNKMQPRNDLKYSDANWVLANPGNSYIVYSYDCGWGVGLKQMQEGKYNLLWMDTVTGKTVSESDILVKWGTINFKKPKELGEEVVVYIRKNLNNFHN